MLFLSQLNNKFVSFSSFTFTFKYLVSWSCKLKLYQLHLEHIQFFIQKIVEKLTFRISFIKNLILNIIYKKKVLSVKKPNILKVKFSF